MLLSVSKVRKAFGTDVVLSDITFRIERREKVLLLGRNGCGKTTLLKIITGQDEPDSGNVQLARGAKIGYLRQEQQVEKGVSVLEEVERVLADQLALKSRLDELEARLEQGATDEDLEEYATVHEHFLELEGYSAERDLQTVLKRMGFEESEFSKPTSALSGGEKTRLALARLLLEQPDLLILDEPTNHLDLQAAEWLEGWLRSYPGAVLLVSHDRAFLEGMGDKVLDMRDGEVKAYPGPFEKFLKLRDEEREANLRLAKKQQAQADKLDEYVRRFMNSERTAQARGRLKQLQKLEASRVVVKGDERGMKATFGPSKRSGDIVVEVKDLSFGFTEELLLKDVSWIVQNGERWGVVGENGAGKSTLIKLALGNLEPWKGSIRWGANVEMGYFAQDVADLDPEKSPLDTLVWDCDLSPGEARNLLGRFLLVGDDVFRPIKTLSGGEKNKLVLASLTTLNPNLLVLDEPTNHLDMDSRDALGEVLNDFKGTLILISHDRWLLNRVTNRTLNVRRQGTETFPGNYGEFASRKGTSSVSKSIDQVKTVGERLSPRELSKEISRLERDLDRLEKEVEKAEADISALEQRLATVGPNDDVVVLAKEYESAKSLRDDLTAKWVDTDERLASLRSMQ